MFKTDETTAIKEAAETVDRGYVLTAFDEVSIDVFTKDGERLIDPDQVLRMSGPNGQQIAEEEEEEKYLIDEKGEARFPMVGVQKIGGLTIRETELFLQKAYAKFYEDVFVKLTCESRRVVVLGVPGGLVLPLTYEKISLAEVVAMSKGFVVEGKAQSIRLLRGEEVFVVDFSTVEGYRKGNMTVLPGDIIYMEPVVRPLAKALGDYGQILSVSISLLTLILVVAK
jgi:polysaccharide export outer membrane protein